MELRIRDGDYVADGAGGVERLAGERELLQRVLFRLCARRGALPFLPELGSRMHLLSREKPARRLSAARQYAAEALAEENVEIRDVTLTDGGAGRLEVSVFLAWQGETLEVTVTV